MGQPLSGSQGMVKQFSGSCAQPSQSLSMDGASTIRFNIPICLVVGIDSATFRSWDKGDVMIGPANQDIVMEVEAKGLR